MTKPDVNFIFILDGKDWNYFQKTHRSTFPLELLVLYLLLENERSH
jgi:hypothetical protein